MKYLVILVLGLLLGAGIAVFLLGAPGFKSAPGERVQAPSADTAGTESVVITVGNGFFNDLLGAVFRDLDPPAFNIADAGDVPGLARYQPSALQQGCANTITLMQEVSNSKTQVQFANGKIQVPMAFNGSYNLLGNCTQFKGWAQSSLELRFDQEKQTVYGQVVVEGVNLEGVNPVANSFVTTFVRNAIDQRVNPLELIRAPQLQLLIPVKASNGSVKAQVKDVRAEVLDGTLKLHIFYEFSGARGQQQSG
ncbi:MAG TPA: hypothetical protein VIB00_10605 [Pyrinomonadaceae bacterium]|jgi:hypothetical protein